MVFSNSFVDCSTLRNSRTASEHCIKNRRIAIRVAVALVCSASASVLTACTPFDLPPERLSSGDVTLYTDVPVVFSAELLGEWARHRRAVGALLGTPADDDSAIDYALYGHTNAVRDACTSASSTATACAFGSYVATNEAFHRHELVHVFTNRRGRPHPFLAEGLAEILAQGSNELLIAHEFSLQRIGSSEAFRSPSDTSSGYRESASFVSFLIDTFGINAVMRLYECDDVDGDLEALDDAARDALGTTITDAHARWVAQPAEPYYTIARHTYECATPAATLGVMEAVRLVRGVGGGLSAGGVVRTFEVMAPATLRIRAEAVDPRVVVGSCDRGPDVLAASGSRTLEAETAILPGRYHISLTGTLISPTDGVLDGMLELTLTPR